MKTIHPLCTYVDRCLVRKAKWNMFQWGAVLHQAFSTLVRHWASTFYSQLEEVSFDFPLAHYLNRKRGLQEDSNLYSSWFSYIRGDSCTFFVGIWLFYFLKQQSHRILQYFIMVLCSRGYSANQLFLFQLKSQCSDLPFNGGKGLGERSVHGQVWQTRYIK